MEGRAGLAAVLDALRETSVNEGSRACSFASKAPGSIRIISELSGRKGLSLQSYLLSSAFDDEGSGDRIQSR